MNGPHLEYPGEDGRRSLGWMSDVAEDLATDVSGACERVVVAGSVRRRRARVRDVELVAVPRIYRVRAEVQADLFALGHREVERSALWDRLEAGREAGWCQPLKPGVPDLVPDPKWPEKRGAGSRYWRLLLLPERVKVDLFLATPETWGLVLAIRTGSADFSRALVTRWTAVSGGGHAVDGRLCWPDGRAEDTREEEDVFRALRCRWVDPPERRGPGDLVPL